MKAKSVYACTACGATTPRWQGQCPGCRAWNTLVEEIALRPAKGAPARGLSTRVQPLSGVSDEALCAASTGSPELDRFLGKGLIAGSSVLLGGEPGIGKSTLLLQLAGAVAGQGRTALYVSGEESLPQLKARAERLGVLGDHLLALASNTAEDVVAAVDSRPAPGLVILDSVQTFVSGLSDGLPGSVSQVRAVSAQCIEAVKRSGAALVLVGHVTKEGQIAGPKLLEHMVDTVLYLEGDRRQVFRLLRVLKNRFGPTDELLVYQMREAGLALVPDPSTFFLGEREPGHPGTAVVMTVDGGKPFAVEVQALAARTFLSIPRRTALGVDVNRLHLLLAVMEKHLHINFGQSDVYAKLGAGLRLTEPGLDLGLAAAILSSFFEQALPEGAIFWGEIDLNGRIRACAADETRLKQAERLGYGPIIRAGGKKGLKTLADLAVGLFGKGK